jgi:predicted DNA-binding helix-hairpin-helix protein
MERMIATAEILRKNYLYRGYIHLKIMPGASWGCVERATQVADRVSVNLEAPGQKWLRRLAPDKKLDDLLAPLLWVRRLLEDGDERRVRRAGQTTQFVVGAAGEPDREILQTTERLYRELKLARVYFSAFQPLEGTPLEDQPATPLLREHRLYQTDFLFRRYGFALEELIFDQEGNLSLEADPKMAWALYHPHFFPVEVNQATKEELLRVPGIGPKSASRIIKGRRLGRLRTLEDLQSLGAVAKRAAPFITLSGKRPAFQLSLWDPLSEKPSDKHELLSALSLPPSELVYYS